MEKENLKIYEMMNMEKYNIIIGENKIEVANPTANQFIINGNKTYDFVLTRTSTEINRICIGNQFFNLLCKQISENEFEIWIKHFVFKVKVEDSRSQLLSRFAKNTKSKFDQVIIIAPMPGLLTKIEVKIGEIIHPGKGLIILEAMKMENEIRSSVYGKVRSIEVMEHVSVEKDQTLIIIDPIDSESK